MDTTAKNILLDEIPLFSGLSAKERSLIREKCSIAEFKKDEVIYNEGSPASNFYCIITGRVLIYALDQQGHVKVLEYLHRGKYFGIISLLTGDTHSVTSKAINDCKLLTISKDDFNIILKKIPQLAIDLSKTLSRRLKSKDLHLKTIFESTVISIFSSYSQAGKTLYALNLGLSLKRETHKSVLVLDICSMDVCHTLPGKLGIREFPVMDLSQEIVNARRSMDAGLIKDAFGLDLLCMKYNAEDESGVKRLVEILSHLVNDYHYIILDLPSAMDRFVFEVLNQSDLIHVITGSEQLYLKRTSNLIKRLKADFQFPPAKIKVIINAYRLSRLTSVQQQEMLGHDIFATLPKIEFNAVDRLILDRPDCEYSKAVRRISRNVGDCLVGLALGVGVAYGLCHIGVLKVIEEEGIPIDVIVGSSMGAVVASLWATGKSSREILELTKEFKERRHIWGIIDLTLPYLGFLKGNKLYNFLKKHLGNKTFYDVKLPLKIIASDIRKKETRVLEKGLLRDAIMASCSMPGVFQPFKLKEDFLFDGGMVSPLPTEPLFHMGVKKIIAVNVTPSKEDILSQYEKLKTHLVTSRFKSNIVEIIFNSIELMQSELAARESQLADVVLHPDVGGMHWLELHRSSEFAKRGEDEARKNLDKIWQVINE